MQVFIPNLSLFHDIGGKTFGLYYDDPGHVSDHSKLRADLGFLFKSSSVTDEEKEALLKKYSDLGYKHVILPKTKTYSEYYTVKFPAFVSFMIAGKKFYPNAKERLAEEGIFRSLTPGVGYSFIETYSKDKTFYYAPRENFKDFYLTKL